MENRIVITHYVNPHQFWYKRLCSRISSKVNKLFQTEVDEYCKKHYGVKESEHETYYEASGDEVVAVYDNSRNRWTRCRVVGSSIVDKNLRRKYQLWSLDEGIPKEATADNIKPLPEKFINKNVIVKRGAIRNVLPAFEQSCDPTEDRLRKIVVPAWDCAINTTLKSLIDCAEQTCFENVSSHTINGEDIYFGDLRFSSKQNTIVDAKDILLQTGSVVGVEHAMVLEHFKTNGTLNTMCLNRTPPVINGHDLSDSAVAVDAAKDSVDFTQSAKESLPNALPETVPRSILAKLKRISKQTSQQIHNAHEAASNNITQQSICSTNLLLNPKECLILAKKPCRDPAVSTHVMDSSFDLEMFTHENSPKLPKIVKHNLARMKLANEPSVTVKAAPTPIVETITPPVSLLPDIVPGDFSDGNLQSQDISTLSVRNLRTASLTIQGNRDMKRFEKLIKEEQCVLSSLRHHRILVHGQTFPRPIDSIANANFCPSVHQELEQLRIRTVYRLQAYAWPHIMRGNSLICVNTASTGKTFAFLPAVCSLAKMQIEEALVPSAAGPVGIILCYSSREVQRIAHLCRRMLNSEANKHLAVVECYGIRKVTETCNSLFSGCAILVTTAPTYRRLYETMPEAFVRKRIQMIAIDNIEEMLRHFAADVLLLCKTCDKPELQMIVTAEFWHPTLASFLRKYKNMIVCVGAYLEAAVYAKVLFQLRLRRNDGSKQDELVRYIKEVNYRTQRTIVFGSTVEDLDPIVEALRQHSINHLVCSESTIINQHDGFRNWDERSAGDMVVLVCLDELLGDLNVSKAQHIIHYTLPSSWSSFTKRFATSFRYYDCPYLAPNDGDKLKGRPSTLVLLDENNNHQLPKLIDFLELHNVQFAQELSQLAQNIRSVCEYMKIVDGTTVSALCPRLLGLAACRNYKSCVFRHALAVSDLAQDGLPTAGMVRLNIQHIFSPVHFAVRLEAHRLGTSCSWTTLSDHKQFLLHDITMQAYFANTDRHQMYGELMRNNLCAFFDEHNYWRCRIIHFEADRNSSAACDVQLKLIDTGRIVRAKSTSLLCLPDQFRSLPGQAIDVRIAGVVPHDFEEEWDKHSTVCVQQWIDGYIRRPNRYADGKIVLALQGTLWIDDLLLVEHLDALKTEVVSVRVKASIVSKRFGVLNKNSFESIRKLVQQCEAQRKDTGQFPSAPIAVVGDCGTAEREHPTDRDEGAGQFTAAGNPIPSSNHELNEDHRVQPPATKRSLLSILASGDNKEKLDGGTAADVMGSHTVVPGDFPAEKISIISSASSFELLSTSGDSEQYSFEALEKGNHYNIAIGRYYTPDKFYVYQLHKLRIIQQKVNTYASLEGNVKPLTQVRTGGYCLVYYDSIYQRGRIVEVRGTEIIVFFLDFGGTMECYREELFEISPHLLEELPFAAIEGTFAFIRPLGGASSWTAVAGNAIYDDVLQKYNNGSMFALVMGPRDSEDRLVEGCHRYEMLLTDGDSTDPYSIVSELVQHNLAMFVVPSDHWTTGIGDDDDADDEEHDDFVQLNFTHEEVRAVLAGLSKAQKIATDESSDPAISSPHSSSSSSMVELTEARKVKTPLQRRLGVMKRSSKSGTGTVQRTNPSPALAMLPPLDCDYRFPQTAWRQDDFFVMLYVSAPEVVRYDLTVHVQSLLLQFVRDDRRYMLPLNLFGPIEPEHTTHEVRGLAIVIRLVTRGFTTWRWPTLVSHTDKLGWLKKAAMPQRQQCDGDESGSELSDLMENGWNDLLPSKLDCKIDSESYSSHEEDDLGLQTEDAMEEEIFLRQK